MTSEGMGPCLAVVGGTTKEVFEAYIERVLAPTLRAGQVVVADNLAAHKGEEVCELVEAQGCELLFLAALLAGLQPHRGGVLEDQRPFAQGGDAHSRGADRGDGGGDLGGHDPGRSGLL